MLQQLQQEWLSSKASANHSVGVFVLMIFFFCLVVVFIPKMNQTVWLQSASQLSTDKYQHMTVLAQAHMVTSCCESTKKWVWLQQSCSTDICLCVRDCGLVRQKRGLGKPLSAAVALWQQAQLLGQILEFTFTLQIRDSVLGSWAIPVSSCSLTTQ